MGATATGATNVVVGCGDGVGVGRGAKLPHARVGKPHNNEIANNSRNGTDRLPRMDSTIIEQAFSIS